MLESAGVWAPNDAAIPRQTTTNREMDMALNGKVLTKKCEELTTRNQQTKPLSYRDPTVLSALPVVSLFKRFLPTKRYCVTTRIS